MSDDENLSEEQQTKKKQKREKVGFRDRKVFAIDWIISKWFSDIKKLKTSSIHTISIFNFLFFDFCLLTIFRIKILFHSYFQLLQKLFSLFRYSINFINPLN